MKQTWKESEDSLLGRLTSYEFQGFRWRLAAMQLTCILTIQEIGDRFQKRRLTLGD